MTPPRPSPDAIDAAAIDGDAELRALAIRGDLAATRLLLEAVAPRVVAVVRRVLGATNADVDDVAQESLIAIVRALPAFRGDCAVEGYAARIAVRTAVAARRRGAARRERLNDLARQEELSPLAPSLETSAAARRRLAVLRELLAELPSGQGESLALRVVLGCSIVEIADATDTPVNTVRSRLRLAKQALRARIEGEPALAEELEVER